MEEGYRVPKLEEFVQGFEFEVGNDYQWIYINSDKLPEPKYRVWRPAKVWWKANPKEMITEKTENGNIFIYSGYLNNFFKPFDEQSFIDQELVRVKINQ